jgi:phosphoenolpyruvate synthase/pyruvate phosphate dikinase
MEIIRNFKKLNKHDAAIAGGKGASLGEMTRAGIPVPPGFVILSDAFEKFLEETDLNVEIDTILHSVNHKEIHTVENASEKIQALILGSEMPEEIAAEIKKYFTELDTEYVAVRSSATAEDSASAAWAGQLDSFLNTTEKDLLENVKKCWASLFTPRAIFYRFEKELHKQKISVAVVVQKMVESEVSGIAFSVHPVTQDRNQLIIEAGFGLGEAIVSGQITPDSYVVEKTPRKIIDKNIAVQTKGIYRGGWKEIPQEQGEKQALNDEQILELSQLILKIEEHYGFPCDIEWAFEKEKFYITQSRPITTLDIAQTSHESELSKINSDNYDFLWRVGFSYLFCSIYYHSGYSERDFVFTWNYGEHFNFVNKEQRRELAKEGLVFYTKKFNSFKSRIEEQTPIYSKKMDDFLKTPIEKMTNAQLAESFLELSDLILKGFKDYFYLEYHSTDEVARIVEENDKNYDIEKLKTELEEVGRLKLALREVWNKALYKPSTLDRYAQEISKRLSLGGGVYSYRFDELVKMLKGENVTIPDRSVVVWGKFSEGKDVVGKDAEYIIRNLQEVDKNVKEFKGNIGNKGFYKGRVKKIEFSEKTDFAKEINLMGKGDVLVSGSTGPEMILACKKAGAIITDEGGIISHAAIVSRELGIPSIIGTKIATRMLDDGDIVEVNANNGVVKILKQNAGSKEDVLRVDGITWFLTITRNVSFWHQVLGNEGHYAYTKDFGVDANLETLSFTVRGTESHLFMHQPNYGEYSQAVLDAINTKEKTRRLKKKYQLFAKELLFSLHECKENLNFKTWEKFTKQYSRMTAGLMLTATLGRSGGELLGKKLKDKGFGDLEIPAIIAAITYPSEHTPLFQSQIDLLMIGVQIRGKKISEKKRVALLNAWLLKYRNIPVNFCDEPWDLKDAENQLNSILKKDCRQELELQEKGHRDRVEKSSKLLKKINDEGIDILAYGIAEGTLINEFRKNIFSRVSLEYRPIFQKIAEMTGSKNWRDCFYLTPGEMGTIVKGEKLPIAELMKNRMVIGTYRTKESPNKVIESGALKKLYEYIKSLHSSVSSVSTEDKMVKGHSANHGKVKGIVKIILSSKDFYKLNPGEILVTTMTSVDFVPVMERAAAFVTNEGGITSHASIVAREMNKPCIIGTKNATQVLKDGDLVEVDADNGVVKILK